MYGGARSLVLGRVEAARHLDAGIDAHHAAHGTDVGPGDLALQLRVAPQPQRLEPPRQLHVRSARPSEQLNTGSAYNTDTNM